MTSMLGEAFSPGGQDEFDPADTEPLDSFIETRLGVLKWLAFSTL
jgi:hypothetical protein